jgi:SSS family solute:Na+ symporter
MAKLACQIANDQMTGLGLIGQFGAMNWLYFSLLLFGISVVTIVIVSLLTPRQTAQKISGLTYASLTADDRKELRESWNLFDVIITAAILAIIVGIYIYFSFGFWTT